MIYEAVERDEPLRQGDIFRNIPRVDFSLAELAVMEGDGGMSATSWRDFIDEPEGEQVLTAVLPVKPVDAILITQDCDCVRGEFLSLCQIDTFVEVAGISKTPPKDAKGWQRKIMGGMTEQPRLFYLPEDESVGFTERRAVDFRVVLPVKRADLEDMRDSRVARLNPVADEHFRESLSQFFRRYPVNGWYPLTHEEFEKYSDGIKNPAEKPRPYPWQGASDS